MYEEALIKQDALDATAAWLTVMCRVHPVYAMLLMYHAHRFHFCGWILK